MAKQARVAYQSFAERFGERVRELCSQWIPSPALQHGFRIHFDKMPPERIVRRTGQIA